VTLPSKFLVPFGIDRRRKREALAKLEAAGLIAIKVSHGRTANITLLREET
jgi:hypothetical protein